MSLGSIFDIAGTGMTAQSTRLNTTASNIANAETPGANENDIYRNRQPVFLARLMQETQAGFAFQNDAEVGVQVAGIVESDAPLQQRFEPDHPLANEDGYVFYPNVNVVEEMTNMISASRSFQVNVEVMNSARQMIERLLTLGQ